MITDKATGNVAATLKAKVTVKANAAELEIVAADGVEYDGATVAPGSKIDFNRTMADQDGNWSNIKGKYVTDNTRWVVEPADKGVTVDQSNGVVTVAEDAKGEFTVYAETYQSDKYNQTTATSNKVVLTVADDTFEVTQETAKTLVVKFDTKVASVGDVTVNRLYKGFELPVPVKGAKLAEDGMSATVELYSALKNNEEYAINVPGYDVQKLTASLGTPVEVLLYADAKNKLADAELVYIDGLTNLVSISYRLIDANGVDVTDEVKNNGTLFLTAPTDEAGNYFVTDEKIWFNGEGIDVTVSAEFQMYDNNGNLLTPAKGEKTFISQKPAPVEVLGLADWKVGGDWNNKKQSLPLDETATLAFKIKLSNDKTVEVADSATPINQAADYIRLEELNPEVAALSGFNIVYFKQGTAKILVYYCFTDGNGNPDELPIAQVNVEAKAATKLANMGLDKQSISVGTVAGEAGENFDRGTVAITAKTNHGGDCTGYTVTVTGVDDKTNAIAQAPGVYAIDGNKVYFYGAALKAANENKDAAQLTFKIKVSKDGVDLEKNVTVIYKSKGADGTEYTRVEANGFGVDVARTAKDDNTKAAKTGTFTVYQYSNGIKVDTLDVVAYDANALTAGTYYFKVVKDGKDISTNANISSVNGVVTLNFSGNDNGKVTYELGAGNYVFSLYEVVSINGKPFARPVNGANAAGSVTCNAGSYSLAGKGDKATLDGDTSDANIFSMFKFKNAQGQDVAADATNYTVQLGEQATDNYVYVKSITFTDDLGDGTYAEYVVPVGVALKK